MTMRPIQWLFRTFPAASRAIAIGLSATLILFVGLRIRFLDSRPALFLIGDSAIGNYRFDPGHRLQDELSRLDPGTRVANWAEPGATPLDYFLQWHLGALATGKPSTVVVAFEPDKFLPEICHHRLDEDGRNLRWIPWDRSGWELFRILTPHERNVAVVQQISTLFFGIADWGRYLWIQHIQWPKERSRMRAATPERRKKIEAAAGKLGRGYDSIPIPDAAKFAALPLSRDAALLMRSLKRSGIEARAVLLPYGNPDLMRKTWPSTTGPKLDSILSLTRNWLDAQGIAFVDLNSAADMAHFPDSVWDDLAHFKDPAAFTYMAQRIHESLAKPPSYGTHP
jgi:hypothetical protein